MRHVLTRIGVLVVVVTGLLAPDPAPAVSRCEEPCPNLAVDPSTMGPFVVTEDIAEGSCQVVEEMVAPGTRRLMRFTFTTPNVGAGDLVIGRPADRPDLFVYSSCHKHYHFREYADYRLWNIKDFLRWSALRVEDPDATAAGILAANPSLHPVVGAKRGFCAIDIRPYNLLAAPQFTSCKEDQGITSGWADEYRAALDGQYVDVTDVAPGRYVLESEVNAEQLFPESSYRDNRAWVLVTVP